MSSSYPIRSLERWGLLLLLILLKLHLVRPDLIFYPILFEVWC